MTYRFIYIFDPLCGWCYGASAGLDVLASRRGVSIDLAPSGLFAGAAARPLDPSMTQHIWSADNRIAELTGATFTARYRDQVLASGKPLDSEAATLALTAVSLTAPLREREALGAIQRGRYVEGRDVTDPAVLADLLSAAGLAEAVAMLAEPQPALLNANLARMARAQALMRLFGLSGVPALLREDGEALAVSDARALYRDPLSLIGAANVA